MAEIKVSIILPVRNEINHIRNCLDSILQFKDIDVCEIIVIDGMSDDGTRDVLQTTQKASPRIKLLDNPAKRVTSGVNIGIKAAQGEIVMRLDAHALYSPEYLRSCLQVMERSGAANVGGTAFALASAPTLTAHAIALAHHSPFGLGGASFRNMGAEGVVETVWPGCFRREVFDKAGLLTEGLERSEDIELNYRIRKAGFSIYLSPLIKVWYFCRPTLGSLLSQRWLDGQGVMQTLRVNADAVRARHFVPLIITALCLAVLMWLGVSVVMRNAAMTQTALLTMVAGAGLYCTASLLFSISAFRIIPAIHKYVPGYPDKKYQIKTAAAIFLPVVFAVLHFSYGLGSIAGLVSLCRPHPLKSVVGCR